MSLFSPLNWMKDTIKKQTEAQGGGIANAAPLRKPAPELKSELYEKTVQASKAVTASPLRNPQAFTAPERGAIVRATAGYQDGFDKLIGRVKTGKTTMAEQKKIAQIQYRDYRNSNAFRQHESILSRMTEEDNNRYELLKQGEIALKGFYAGQDSERGMYGERLYGITTALQGIDPASAPKWDNRYSENPRFMEDIEATLNHYRMDYAPMFDAEAAIKKAEALRDRSGWLEDIEKPFASMSETEKDLLRQEVLIGFSQGKRPIDFDAPQEHMMAEQDAIDMHGMVEVLPGVKMPQYMQIYQKNDATLKEYRNTLVEALSAADQGSWGNAADNIRFELDYIDQQIIANEGFKYRNETPDLPVKAEAGEEKFRKDFAMQDDLQWRNETKPLFVFEDEWKKKLDADPNNQELRAQYDRERKVKGAAFAQSQSGYEMFMADSKLRDYFFVGVMTPQERATYMAYYDDDPNKAHEYAMAMSEPLNKRAAFYLDEANRELAKGNIWQQGLAAGVSVIATIPKLTGALYVASQGEQGKRIDPYASNFAPGKMQQSYRGQLKENTVAKFGEDTFASKAIGFMTDVLFGAADSLVGAGTMGLVGYSAAGASDSVSTTLLRGGTQDQALALGAANLFAEIITEKIPFDNLAKGFKEGFSLKGLAVAFGGETMGEGLSAFIGDRADRVIMVEKSEFEQAVQGLVNDGMGLEAARRQASRDTLMNIMYEGVVGGFSGGLSYGVAGGVGSLMNKDTTIERGSLMSADSDTDVSAQLAAVLSEYQTGQNAPQEANTRGYERAEAEQAKVLQEQVARQEAALEAEAEAMAEQARQNAAETVEQDADVEADQRAPEVVQLDANVEAGIKAGYIPLKAGAVLSQAFPGDVMMQHEYIRKLGGLDMSAAAMRELAVNMKNAQQGQQGFDFLDGPGMTNAAEKASLGAMVKGMLEIAPPDPVVREAQAMMQSYTTPSADAFEIIDKLSALYAQGKASLAELAQNAYQQLMAAVRETTGNRQVQDAMSPAADNVQALIGKHGTEQVKQFMVNVLETVNNTDYQAQQEVMNAVAEASLLPDDAPSAQMLNQLVTGEQAITAETLGAFNMQAQQDAADTTFDDARASMRDELAIANIMGRQIEQGALKDLDAQTVKIEMLQQRAMETQAEVESATTAYDAAKEALSEFVLNMPQGQITADIQKAHKAVVERLAEAKRLMQKSAARNSEAQSAHIIAAEKHQAEYNARLTDMRAAAVNAHVGAINAHNAAISAEAVQDAARQANTPQNADTGQIDGVAPMYAVSAGGLSVEIAPADYQGPVQSVQSIFSKLGQELGVPFNVNSRQYDRSLRKKTAGYFVKRGEVVHTVKAQDLTAAAHEYGHYVDKVTRIGSHPDIQAIVTALQANPAFAQNYTAEQLNGEAVAELFKVYMVNRDQAIQRFGRLVTDMEAGMRKAGILKPFDAARQAIGRTISAGTFEQVKARIVDGRDANKKTAKERVQNFRVQALDSTLAFDEMSKRLRKDKGKDYMMSEDPRMIALKNNRIDNFIRANFESQLVDVQGNTILDRGLADNFNGIDADQMTDFNAYLLLVHEIDRARAEKSIFGNQFNEQQIMEAIREQEAKHPSWKQNRLDLQEWYDAFFRAYVVDTGVLTQAEYDTMRRMYPNYVPTYRQMPDGAKGAPKKSSGDARTGVGRATGSDLNVRNPVEALAQQVMFYTQQAHRLQLGNVFADYIDRYDNTGMFAEKIQKDVRRNPEMERIAKDVEGMIAERTGEQDMTAVRGTDMLEADILRRMDSAMFTFSDQATGSGVINVLNTDGTYRSYVVHDQSMLDIIQAVPATKLAAIFNFTGKAVRLISSTATGTNPFFAVTNGMRDMATQMVYGTTSTNFLTAIPKWLANLPRTLMGVLSNTEIAGKQILADNKYTEAYRQYAMFAETGARYSAEIGRDTKSMMEGITKPGKAKRAGQGALKVITMQFLNEMIENNTRFLEFYKGKSAIGKNVDNLNTFEGRLRAGLAAAGVTVDFRRHGQSTVMREIAAVVPFFNAGIQGMSKAASIFTNENQGRRAQIAGKIVLNMTLLGVAQAVLNNMKLTDDEKDEFEAMDDGLKAKGFFVKVGPEKLLRIPIMQDPLGMMFYAFGRVIGGAATGEGGSVADEMVNAMKSILQENTNFSTVYSPVQNLIENKTWYGGTIETAQMLGLDRRERYNDRTTDAAKWLSDNIGILSPVQWDYIIPQYTGVWGKLGIGVLRSISGDKSLPEAVLENLNKEMSSRFFTTPAYASQLYNNYKASKDGIIQIGNHNKQGRRFVMFDQGLTQEELNKAVTDAARMTRKGGALYDIDQQINARWDEYGVIVGDESLTDDEREKKSLGVRQEINQLALKGQNIIAEFEAQYFPGTARTNGRVVAQNAWELHAVGVDQAVGMNEAVYEDYQAGKSYVETLTALGTKWGTAAFSSAAPSFQWTGLDKESLTDDQQQKAVKAYTQSLESGVEQNRQKLLTAGTKAQAEAIMERIKKEATVQAQRVAFPGDKYYTRGASDYMNVQLRHNTEYSRQSLSLSKKWDDPYYVSVKPSYSWKGFDLESASAEKIKAIEGAYYDAFAAGLNRDYQKLLNAASAEEARKIIQKIANNAGSVAKKEALRK